MLDHELLKQIHDLKLELIEEKERYYQHIKDINNKLAALRANCTHETHTRVCDPNNSNGHSYECLLCGKRW